MTRTQEGIHYELILLFERFKLKPSEVFQRLKSEGYNKSTIYRYHQRWLDADTKFKTIVKKLVF